LGAVAGAMVPSAVQSAALRPCEACYSMIQPRASLVRSPPSCSKRLMPCFIRGQCRASVLVIFRASVGESTPEPGDLELGQRCSWLHTATYACTRLNMRYRYRGTAFRPRTTPLRAVEECNVKTCRMKPQQQMCDAMRSHGHTRLHKQLQQCSWLFPCVCS
jgi:hypothetical protein